MYIRQRCVQARYGVTGNIFKNVYLVNQPPQNYRYAECRFIKPIYPGSTIEMRFICKEKVDQEKKDEHDIAKGIVKWLVDI